MTKKEKLIKEALVLPVQEKSEMVEQLINPDYSRKGIFTLLSI